MKDYFEDMAKHVFVIVILGFIIAVCLNIYQRVDKEVREETEYQVVSESETTQDETVVEIDKDDNALENSVAFVIRGVVAVLSVVIAVCFTVWSVVSLVCLLYRHTKKDPIPNDTMYECMSVADKLKQVASDCYSKYPNTSVGMLCNDIINILSGIEITEDFQKYYLTEPINLISQYMYLIEKRVGDVDETIINIENALRYTYNYLLNIDKKAVDKVMLEADVNASVYCTKVASDIGDSAFSK